MSAEELGRDLMGKVRETTLDNVRVLGLFDGDRPNDFSSSFLCSLTDTPTLAQLFARLRTLSGPNLQLTGLPPIDELLTSTAGDGDPPWPLCSIIQLSSPGPGHGKLSLIYLLTALGVLPFEHRGVNLAGRNGAVVVLDTLVRFDVERLASVTKRWIVCRNERENTVDSSRKDEHETHETHDTNESRGTFAGADSAATHLTEDEIDGIVSSALRHVHIFTPQSSASLQATLHSLESYLLNDNRAHDHEERHEREGSRRRAGTLSTHPSSHRRVSSIVLTDAASFHWMDRADDELARTMMTNDRFDRTNTIDSETAGSGTTTRRTQATTGQDQQSGLSQLHDLANRLSCTVISSTSQATLLPSSSSSTESPLPFPSPFPFLVPVLASTTLQSRKRCETQVVSLHTTRRAIRGFPPGTSAAEAHRDARERNAAVGRNRFDVRVRVARSGLQLDNTRRQNPTGVHDDSALRRGQVAGDTVNRSGQFEVRIHDMGVDVVDDLPRST